MNYIELKENIRYNDGEMLAIENDHILCRNKKGEFCKIPLPKFRHNQIVRTTTTYFSPKSFTRLINPTYSPIRGWVYGENYINRNGAGGGCGFAFDETEFLPLENAADILFAKRIELNESLAMHNSQIKSLSAELGKVEYAINLVQP